MNTTASRARWLRVGIAATLLAVQLDGCANTGAPAHGLSDPRVADQDAADDFDLARVSRGAEIRVILRDGATVVGRYRGVGRMEPAAYEKHVANLREERDDSLPPIPVPGSDIVVRTKRKTRPARLTAYGLRSLELQWYPDEAPRQVGFGGFESVTDSSGREWAARVLLDESAHGRLPSFAQLEVETAAGDATFPVDEVVNVFVRTSNGQWVAGALVVVALGVIVLVAVAAAPYYYMGCADWSYQRQLGLRNAP